MDNTVLDFLISQKGNFLDNSPSPVSRWLNGKLNDVSLGKATLEYTVRSEMINPLGTLQGGIFTTMMDDTLGIAVYSLGKDKLYTSVNFYVDYLGSAIKGEKIFVDASIVREGNTILNVAMHIKNAAGKLLARGNSNLVAKEIEGLSLPRFKGMEAKYPGMIDQNKS